MEQNSMAVFGHWQGRMDWSVDATGYGYDEVMTQCVFRWMNGKSHGVERSSGGSEWE